MSSQNVWLRVYVFGTAIGGSHVCFSAKGTNRKVVSIYLSQYLLYYLFIDLDICYLNFILAFVKKIIIQAFLSYYKTLQKME